MFIRCLFFSVTLVLFSNTSSALPFLPTPYLQNVTSEQATIVWETQFNSWLRLNYGLTPEVKHTIVQTQNPRHHHAVTLKYLHPNTRYYYKIYYYDLFPSPVYSFKTAPCSAESKFVFGVVGDSGELSLAQSRIALQMESHRMDFLIHTGDIAYPEGSDFDYFLKFFWTYNNLLHRVPFYPTLGNHDAKTQQGNPYLRSFHLPTVYGSGSELYYAFDWGNALLISLDSILSPVDVGSPQYQWLEKTLSNSKQTWKFIFFHVPVVSSALKRIHKKLHQNFVPLFEHYGVDMVFQGHDHYYERSKRIKFYEKESPGIIYLVTGGGGADLQGKHLIPVSYSQTWIRKYHFLQVMVSNDKLSVFAIDDQGKIIDEFGLSK